MTAETIEQFRLRLLEWWGQRYLAAFETARTDDGRLDMVYVLVELHNLTPEYARRAIAEGRVRLNREIVPTPLIPVPEIIDCIDIQVA